MVAARKFHSFDPTPTLFFAIEYLGTDAGIMVTVSPNPADYNGFKMTFLG
jgi:phosphomannomutase